MRSLPLQKDSYWLIFTRHYLYFFLFKLHIQINRKKLPCPQDKYSSVINIPNQRKWYNLKHFKLSTNCQIRDWAHLSGEVKRKKKVKKSWRVRIEQTWMTPHPTSPYQVVVSPLFLLILQRFRMMYALSSLSESPWTLSPVLWLFCSASWWWCQWKPNDSFAPNLT